MSVNKVILVGRVGKDPEVRYTGGGQAVANFSVATDESYKNKDNEKVKKTEWHRVVIWGKLAEIVEKYITKGSLVYLEGKISTSEWEDKEGNTRVNKDIVCDTMRMLGGNDKEDNRTEERPAKTKGKTTTKTSKRREPEPEQEENDDEPYQATDEDVPF